MGREFPVSLKFLVVVFTACAMSFLSLACSTSESSESAHSAQWLQKYGLQGKDAKEITNELDKMLVAQRPVDLIASVEPERLVLSDSSNKVALPYPDDEFYLSFAPYENQTHDCYFHSLTTCLGELSATPIQVRVIDNSSGEILVDRSMETFDNGFAGLWLPRNRSATLTVRHGEKTATETISTDAEAATCLTAVHLS